jgi:hypothetical protein
LVDILILELKVEKESFADFPRETICESKVILHLLGRPISRGVPEDRLTLVLLKAWAKLDAPITQLSYRVFKCNKFPIIAEFIEILHCQMKSG